MNKARFTSQWTGLLQIKKLFCNVQTNNQRTTKTQESVRWLSILDILKWERDSNPDLRKWTWRATHCSISLLAPFKTLMANESTGAWLFSDKKNELSNAKVQIFIEKSNGDLIYFLGGNSYSGFPNNSSIKGTIRYFRTVQVAGELFEIFEQFNGGGI